MIDVTSDDLPYRFIANSLYDGAFADIWSGYFTCDYEWVFCRSTLDDYPHIEVDIRYSR